MYLWLFTVITSALLPGLKYYLLHASKLSFCLQSYWRKRKRKGEEERKGGRVGGRKGGSEEEREREMIPFQTIITTLPIYRSSIKFSIIPKQYSFQSLFNIRFNVNLKIYLQILVIKLNILNIYQSILIANMALICNSFLNKCSYVFYAILASTK